MYNRVGIWQSASPDLSLPSDHPSAPSANASPNSPHNYISIPLDMIPTDISLPCSLYVRISERFVLFRKAGDRLTASRAQALSDAGNGTLYIALAEWNQLLHSLESILAAGTHAAGLEIVDDVTQGLRIRNLLVAYGREIDRAKTLDAQMLARIERLAYSLAEILHKNPNLPAKILRRYQEPALYHVNHAVNVAIYAAAIACKQSMDLATLKLLTFAALVHNVGNIMVPAEILFKPGELTIDEKNAIDSHILHGAALLQELRAPKEVVLNAMQHHDRFDGQGGSPVQPKGNEIHLFARICCIADVFDALTSHRSHHLEPLSPKEAVRRMTDMSGKFDPAILPTVAEPDSP